MLTLTGKVLQVIPPSTNKTTGEVIPPAVEVLHQVRGKSVVDTVKIDATVSESWGKAVGHDIAIEVNYYALKTKEGGIQKGLTLADKSALPVLSRPVARPAAVAA